MKYVAKFADVVEKDEQVLWTGRPKFISFMMRVVPEALVKIALGVIGVVFKLKLPVNDVLKDNILFSASLILIGVGLWNIVKKRLLFDNTFYAFTNRRVMIHSGIINTIITVIEYREIVDIKVSTNFFERMHKTGTIRFVLKPQQTTNDDAEIKDRWEAIDEPYEVFEKVKQLKGADRRVEITAN